LKSAGATYAGDQLKRKNTGILEVMFYISFLVVSVYLLLVLLSPLLIQSDNRVLLSLGAASYIFNVLMCHQLPERSFELFGQYMPICSRDTGIFAGIFLACTLSFISSRLPSILKSGKLAVISLVPLGVDGVMQLLGFWESTNSIRFVTGFLAGSFVSYYAVSVFIGQPKINRKALQYTLLLLPLFLAFFAASLYLGERYLTKSEVISKAKAINNIMDIKVFYIAPRAFSSSIARDPYLSGYQDTVLDDVARIGGSAHPYGAWVAVVSNSSKSEGRYIFASGSSENYFYDAMSGELVGKFMH